MKQLDILFSSEPEDLLRTLPQYQQEIINSLLQKESDYLLVVDKWLTSKPTNTFGFGGDSRNPSLYKDVVLDELEKFICGDKKYSEDRKKLGTTTNVAVGAIAHAIGASLGVAGAYILPVVVLLIINAGKLPLNAWCEYRKNNKKNL
jgi:hypothetical protein